MSCIQFYFSLFIQLYTGWEWLIVAATCTLLAFSNTTTCTYGLRGPPSRLWPKCNRLLRLGRPQGAVTLPRWCEWWYVWAWSTRRGLKPKFYRLPRPWSLWGSSPARENSHGRTGNRTQDLMASSQKFWPPSREAGLYICINTFCFKAHRQLLWYSLFNDALSSSECTASNERKTDNNEMETKWKVANAFYRKVLYLQLSVGPGSSASQDHRYPIRNWKGAPSAFRNSGGGGEGELQFEPHHSVLIVSRIRC
jgi:hypothetical protein